MKLFIKCLKESLRYYFGRDGVVIRGIILAVTGIFVSILIVLAVPAAVIGFFYTANWLTNIIITGFQMNVLCYPAIIVLCSLFLFSLISGISAFANDVRKRMKEEKEQQIMFKEESQNGKEHEEKEMIV